MKFANPDAWRWAWVALPIVVCYLAKHRAARVAVSTILFWQRAAQRSPARWRAWLPRRWVSLAAQLIVAACLVLTLVQPFFASDSRAPRRWALVVDESASMWATDERPSRLQAAIRLGRRSIDTVRPGDSVAIVAAGARASIVQSPTDDRAALHRALDELTGTDAPIVGSDCVLAAVTLARQIISADIHGTVAFANEAGETPVPPIDSGRVVLLSDGCFDGADRLATATDIEWVRIGAATGNVAITACGARRNADDPAGCRLFVEVTNLSAATAKSELMIDVGNRTIELATLRLEPEAVWQKTIRLSSSDLSAMADGTAAMVRLTTTDALMADNRAAIELPTCSTLDVILVSGGNQLLQAALEAQPGLKLTVVERLPDELMSEASDVIVVFDGETPANLPAGRLLVVGPANSCDCWTIGGKLAHAAVDWQESDSPLLVGVRLEQARLDGVRRLTFSSPAHVLANTASDEPLYAALDRPRGRVLVLAASTDEGDLPRRTAFPILIGNALTWLAADPGSALRPRVEIASGLLGRHESDLRPALSNSRSTHHDGSGRYSSHSGIRENSGQNPRPRSDFSRSQLREGVQYAQSPSIGAPPRSLASMMLACGLCSIVVEWWLYQRRGVR